MPSTACSQQFLHVGSCHEVVADVNFNSRAQVVTKHTISANGEVLPLVPHHLTSFPAIPGELATVHDPNESHDDLLQRP